MLADGWHMFKAVGYSVKGSRSDENEDSYLIASHQAFYVVADGVGGGPDGREASKTVVQGLLEVLSDSLDKATIIDAIDRANVKIKKLADQKAVRGMASTLAALWFEGRNAVVFNVGDSRVYRILSSGGIEQLSNDHSRMLENDQKSKNVITKAVGARETVDVEIEVFPCNPGDKFVLMSDGISDVVADEKIAEIVSSGNLSMLEKCMALASEAESRGGRDDKTIILITT